MDHDISKKERKKPGPNHLEHKLKDMKIFQADDSARYRSKQCLLTNSNKEYDAAIKERKKLFMRALRAKDEESVRRARRLAAEAAKRAADIKKKMNK